ncbi:MAG: HPr kinase/phosphorylase [Spirochaetaceae bacterium]|nr:MAG: HPr kinase/phosphorylase [Spirochaetaceae bacterium]
MEKFTVLDLLQLDLKEHDALELKCIGGRPGLVREIKVPELNRPGLALSGFFDNFAEQRLQIFGRGENSYLQKLEKENNVDPIKKLFEYEVPCCVFTHKLEPTHSFFVSAEEKGCPLLQTNLSSSEFSTRVMRALSNIFSPKKNIHGVLVEVFGIGVLIMGESGVGKSEMALELIERGHRLVADDAVEVKCVGGNFLMGKGVNIIASHHMEIRGLGIINVTHLFGVGAIRDNKQIQLVVQLEEWDASKEYDRIGMEDSTIDILGVNVPYLNIPVKPGRNIPIIIETGAMNERLKKLGYHSAKEFNRSIMNWIETERARSSYFENH